MAEQLKHPVFKDCHNLYSRVHLWLEGVWVQIPFIAIFADIPKKRLKF